MATPGKREGAIGAQRTENREQSVQAQSAKPSTATERAASARRMEFPRKRQGTKRRAAVAVSGEAAERPMEPEAVRASPCVFAVPIASGHDCFPRRYKGRRCRPRERRTENGACRREAPNLPRPQNAPAGRRVEARENDKARNGGRRSRSAAKPQSDRWSPKRFAPPFASLQSQLPPDTTVFHEDTRGGLRRSRERKTENGACRREAPNLPRPRNAPAGRRVEARENDKARNGGRRSRSAVKPQSDRWSPKRFAPPLASLRSQFSCAKRTSQDEPKREDDGREGAVSGEAAERPALAHLASRALASLREKEACRFPRLNCGDCTTHPCQ